STGKSAGFSPLRMRFDIGCRLSVGLEHLSAIGHQAAARDEVAKRIDCRQIVPGGKLNDQLTIRCGEEVGQYKERAIRFARYPLDHAFHLGRVMNPCGNRFYCKRGRSIFDRPGEKERGCVRVKEKSAPRVVWSNRRALGDGPRAWARPPISAPSASNFCARLFPISAR